MAQVLDVRRLISRSGDWAEDGERAYSDEYQVIFDSLPKSPEVLGARFAGRKVPQRADRHPDDKDCFCRDVAMRADPRTREVYYVRADYSNKFEPKEREPNPLERAAEYEWESVERVVPLLKDHKSVPIVNTAGDTFADPVEDEETIWVAHVSKNIRTKLPPWFKKARNVVNRDRVQLDGLWHEKGECLLRRVRIGKPKYENEYRFRELSLEIWTNEDGWQLGLWNRGYQQLRVIEETNPETGDKTKRVVKEKIRIRGEYPADPQFLDEDGALIQFHDEKGQLIKEELRKVVILKFQIKREIDFKDLPLK